MRWSILLAFVSLFLVPQFVTAQSLPESCVEANGLTWCYNPEACGEACNDVCAAVGGTSVADSGVWFEAQNTTEECQNISQAFGLGTDVNLSSWRYGCLEDTISSHDAPGGLNAPLLCSTNSACIDRHRTGMDELGVACGPDSRRSACACEGFAGVSDDIFHDSFEDLPELTVVATVGAASEEGPVDGEFTVSLSLPSIGTTVINYTLSGSATGIDDYAALSGIAEVSDGMTSVAIAIDIVDDDESEDTETVILTLAPGSYNIGNPGSDTVTLADNDVSASVVATVGAASEEGPVDGEFTVSLSLPSIGTTVINYTLSGSATGIDDYAALSGTAMIADGMTSVAIAVNVVDDAESEDSETVILTLAPGSYIIGTPDFDVVTLTDNDVSATVVATVSAASEEGPVNGEFTVSLSLPSIGTTVINYTVSGSATAIDDYAALSGTAMIADGMTSVAIAVNVVDDAESEDSETVILTLAPGSYIIGTPDFDVVTLADNDVSASVVATVSAASEEGPVNGEFTVNLSLPSIGTTVINYTLSGSATAIDDYAALSGIAEVSDGMTSVAIAVNVVDDAESEDTETVILTLAPGSYIIGTPDFDMVTLTDNDVSATVVATVGAASEEGPVNGEFTVNLSLPSIGTTVINYTVSGSATSIDDYAALSGTAMIADGMTSVAIAVNVVDDAESEDSETVILTLAPGSYIIGTPDFDVVTLTDNDVSATVVATVSAASEEGPVDGEFTVSLSLPSIGTTVINYTLSGSATAIDDYAALSGIAEVSDGMTSVTIAIDIVDDAESEDSETVILTLAPGSYIIGTPDFDVVTLADNDVSASVVATVSAASEEGPVDGEFTVSLSLPSIGTTVINYTLSGSATAIDDYAALSGIAEVSDGMTSVTIAIDIVDDAESEDSETVILTLAPGSYIIGTPDFDVVTLADNDTRASVVATASGASEEGPLDGEFTISLSKPSVGMTTINYSLSGSATEIDDYAALSGSVVIADGMDTATVVIDVLPDVDDVEGLETVNLTIETGSGYQVGQPLTDTVTIVDNWLRVFVTSTTYTGDLMTAGAAASGLEGADALCNERAAAGSLEGTFVAWLSNSNTSAKDRISQTGPYVRTNDDAKVADDITDILDCGFGQDCIEASIRFNELGESQINSAAWTGTRYTGILFNNDHCSDWTSASGTIFGRTGRTNDISSFWTDDVNRSCNLLIRLYCFQAP